MNSKKRTSEQLNYKTSSDTDADADADVDASADNNNLKRYKETLTTNTRSTTTTTTTTTTSVDEKNHNNKKNRICNDGNCNEFGHILITVDIKCAFCDKNLNSEKFVFRNYSGNHLRKNVENNEKLNATTVEERNGKKVENPEYFCSKNCCLLYRKQQKKIKSECMEYIKPIYKTVACVMKHVKQISEEQAELIQSFNSLKYTVQLNDLQQRDSFGKMSNFILSHNDTNEKVFGVLKNEIKDLNTKIKELKEQSFFLPPSSLSLSPIRSPSSSSPSSSPNSSSSTYEDFLDFEDLLYQ